MQKRLILSVLLFIAASVFAYPRLEITTTSLGPCVADQPCSQRLEASGGTEPLTWRIARGSFPPGLQLDPASGTISGSAVTAGEYEVVIELKDSSKPPQKDSRTFTSKSLPAMALDWKAPPTLQGTSIAGSVVVANNGADAIDLTVIIVAVNEVGKAFALGYQHPRLAAKTTLQEIPFSSQLPAGLYTVRADAIGEIPEKYKIYRAAREAGPFQVPTQ